MAKRSENTDQARMAAHMAEAAAKLHAAINDLLEAQKNAPLPWRETIVSYGEQIRHTLEGDGIGTDSGLVDMAIKAKAEATR